MTDDWISQSKFAKTVDNTHQDLRHFQNFLYKHFYKTEYFDKMPASKVIVNYLNPLANNDFTISDTLPFPDILRKPENSEDYKNVSSSVKTLFTNIAFKETAEYIWNKI